MPFLNKPAPFRSSYTTITVIVCITVLFITWDKPCDKPLRSLITVFMTRQIISTVVTLFFSNWIKKSRYALDLVALVWFIMGNFMIFTTSSCSNTAIPLYYLASSLVIYGYFMLCIPLVWCTCVILILGISRVFCTRKIHSYQLTHDLEQQAEICTICLSTYQEGEFLCKLWCKHQFHETCLHTWLDISFTCPNCKQHAHN